MRKTAKILMTAVLCFSMLFACGFCGTEVKAEENTEKVAEENTDSAEGKKI